MKKFALLLLLLAFQKTQAQIVFCPPGAEWHYSFFDPMFSEWKNEQVKYVRDSVIGIENVKVLSHRRFFNSYNSFVVSLTVLKQAADTVFLRNVVTNHQWQVLYIYSASGGQSWKTTMYNFSTTAFTTTVSVDSVANISINNFNLKRLFVRYLQQAPPQWSSSDIIDERIGCARFLFNYYNPYRPSDGDRSLGILCYQDSSFGLKQFTSKPCNYVDYVGIAENYQNSNIKIYPNPVADIFTIGSEDVFIDAGILLSIKDLCGREIKNQAIYNLNSDPTKVDISDLPKGLYILNLLNHKQVIYSGKLFKD